MRKAFKLDNYVESLYFSIIFEDLNSADSALQLCLRKFCHIVNVWCSVSIGELLLNREPDRSAHRDILNLDYYVKPLYFSIISEDLKSVDSGLQSCLRKFFHIVKARSSVSIGELLKDRNPTAQRIEISSISIIKSNLHIFRLLLKIWNQLIQGYNYVYQSMSDSQRIVSDSGGKYDSR